MKESSLARTLRGKLSRLVMVLILIQPVMDVLSYWITVSGLDNTITLLLRFAVLILTVLAGFCLTRRRWVYWAVVGVLLLFTAGHVAVSIHYGYQDPVSDLINLVRIYHLPLTALAFITFLRREPSCLGAVKRGMAGSLVIILLVELAATVTATDPHTYANKGVGLLGWFLTPNVQSAILSMLVPVAVLWLAEKTRFHPLWTALGGLVGFGMLYLFATRLAYAALVGCALCFAASCLIFKLVQKDPSGRAAAVFLLLAVIAVLLLNVSPMADNNAQTGWNAQQKQADIEELVTADRQAALEAGLTGKALEVEALRSAYGKYLPGVVDRFGLERAAEYYDFSTDVDVVASVRMQKKAFCVLLMEEQPLTRLFGLDLCDVTWGGIIHDAENDFHGIYYLCGGVGLAGLLLWLAWFLLRIPAALIRDFKGTFTPTAVGFGAALICALAHAYFTAGVLRRPNANFYLAVLLAVVYVLTAARPRKATDEVKP